MKARKQNIENLIRKALEEGTDWVMWDTGREYAVMIDTEDADIWTDTFIDCNASKNYHSDTIHKLIGNGYHCEDPVSGLTEEAVKLLEEAGWEVDDDGSDPELILEGAPEFTIDGEAAILDDKRFRAIASYMSDSIREDLAGEGALFECSNEIFLANYLRRDPGFAELLYSVFDIEF